MLIANEIFNTIIAHRLLTTCHKVPSNSYYYQTTSILEKFLDLQFAKNILKSIALIILVLYIYIGLIKLLKSSAFYNKFDVERKLCIESPKLD